MHQNTSRLQQEGIVSPQTLHQWRVIKKPEQKVQDSKPGMVYESCGQVMPLWVGCSVENTVASTSIINLSVPATFPVSEYFGQSQIISLQLVTVIALVVEGVRHMSHVEREEIKLAYPESWPRRDSGIAASVSGNACLLIANCDIVNRHKITMHVIICVVVVVVVSKPELTRCKMRTGTGPAAAARLKRGGARGK